MYIEEEQTPQWPKEKGNIIVETLPFQTSGSKVITQIADQMRKKKLGNHLDAIS
jgi:topoisomerase-4 subunit A